MTITERVARGTKWLDATRPGWRDAITPSSLAMEYGCNCICGQVFSEAASALIGRLADTWGIDGYEYAVSHYATDADWAYNHGFAIPDSMSHYDNARAAEYALLRAAWLHAIHTPTPALEPAELVS